MPSFKDNLVAFLAFSPSKADETIANKNLSARLETILNFALEHNNGSISRAEGLLLYKLSTQLKDEQAKPGRREYIVTRVLDGSISREVQLVAACDFVTRERLSANPEITKEDFDAHCGIRVPMNPEIVATLVDQVLLKHQSDLDTFAHQLPIAKLIASTREINPWVDMALFKPALDKALLAKLGPKPTTPPPAAASSSTKPAKSTSTSTNTSTKAAKDKQPSQKDVLDTKGTSSSSSEWGSSVTNLHKVGENYKTELYITTPDTDRLLKEHVRIVGGKVRTRFPPEPNGILHIGHAKAMNFNFGYAKENGGTCYMRFDDTNPEAEEDEYYHDILDMVEWLGMRPDAIVHASDYFHELYHFCEQLIADGLAYVDHQSSAQMKEERQARRASPYRERPVVESIQIFREMRQGLWDEGSACVRMKTDITSDNPQLWDLVAFRVKFWRHVRTGDEWCVYPTYDFTHCICDSLENITHSLCTVEFRQSRVSYYWLCNALRIYCPVQWEYARLALTSTVLSKRRILKLIDDGIVSGWDDPRLHTLPALRRRGFTPAAINDLCARVGITTSFTTVSSSLLDACLRENLNKTAVRASAVLEPLKLVLVGPTFAQDRSFQLPSSVEMQNNPVDPTMGTHCVPFNSVVYIEKSDFSPTTARGYRRLTPDQTVALKTVGLVLTYKETIHTASGEIDAIHVTYEPLGAENKPKAFIHWVAHPRPAEIRFFDPLISEETPEDDPNSPATAGATATAEVSDEPSWYKGINRHSIHIYPNAMVDATVDTAKVFDNFQFERTGYFCMDKDSNAERKVFNLSVRLKGKD